MKALEAVANNSESPAIIYGQFALSQNELGISRGAVLDDLAVEMTERAFGISKLAIKYLPVQNVNG